MVPEEEPRVLADVSSTHTHSNNPVLTHTNHRLMYSYSPNSLPLPPQLCAAVLPRVQHRKWVWQTLSEHQCLTYKVSCMALVTTPVVPFAPFVLFFAPLKVPVV